MKQIFKCKYCDKSFERYSYENQIIKFCSKNCKRKYKIEQGKYVFYNKETLSYKIENYIKSQGRYITLNEIRNVLRISKKFLTKYKISILQINKKCGFKKPHSKFEENVYNILVDIFGKDNVVRQKYFNDCLSPKESFLYYDFFITNKNILIETYGEQHNNKNHMCYDEYYMEICDNIKNDYANNNNYDLIRIPYKRDFDISYIKSFL